MKYLSPDVWWLRQVWRDETGCHDDNDIEKDWMVVNWKEFCSAS